MNEQINIRKATENDIQGIYDLVVGLAIYEKEPDAVKTTLNDYREAFESGLIEAHVALDGEKLIGMAIYYMTFSTWRGKNLWLEDFFVDSSYRSSGIGQLLFEEYIKTAKAKDAKMVKWQVIDWNEKAKKFYKRNGATIETIWHDCKIIF